MSEALAVQQQPHDFPVVDEPKNINVRMVRAALLLTQGYGSLTRCLVAGGFSRATARNLQSNGLTAKRCLEEAAKLDPALAPAKLLEGGRRVLAEQIAFRDPQKMAVRDAVKLFEATEKYFGGHELQPVNAIFGLTERLAQIAALLAVAQRKGLPVPSYVEAEVVATSSESRELSTPKRELTPDGTTR